MGVYKIVRMATALRNEEKLRKMYLAENDERNVAIEKKTSGTASNFSSMRLALAAIITGFSDMKTVDFYYIVQDDR